MDKGSVEKTGFSDFFFYKIVEIKNVNGKFKRNSEDLNNG